MIAIPDATWSERPLACVVPKPGAAVDAAALAAHLLAAGFAKWQLPDRYELIDAIPRTSTGKFWKLKLRERFAPRVPKMPNVQVELPSMAQYDELLEAL